MKNRLNIKFLGMCILSSLVLIPNPSEATERFGLVAGVVKNPQEVLK